MHIIQVLLFGSLLLISFYGYMKFRNSVLDIILIFLILVTGLVFVAFPALTNRIAHAIGVGRGADMIFYLSIVFFSFILLKLYARLRKLEEVINTLVRENSISNAKIEPGQRPDQT